MGLYFAVFTAVFIIAALRIQAKKDKYLSAYVLLLYIVIVFMLCLRYGQGTDYFAYKIMFESMTSLNSVRNYYHGEPLYLFLCFVFNYFTGDFRIFIAVMSLAEMIMLWVFIRRRSANKAVSVMILMTVMYLVYLGSIIRQGLAMSIFLCFGLELAEKRKWIKYFILCFILTMLHSVSAIYFLVPFVLKFNVASIARSIPICFILSAAIISRMSIVGYTGGDARLIAASERALTFMMIYAVYNALADKRKYQFLMKLYCFGTALYFLFFVSSLVSSRVAVCFKVLEIVIVPCFMTEPSKYRKIFLCYFFMLSAVMFSHSLYGEAINGRYIPSVNFFNFPYVSIFNAEDIYNYKAK